INNGATITVQGSGVLDLNNQNEAVTTTLTLVSGLDSAASVTTGTGTLTVANNITLNTQTNTFGNVNPVTISGTPAIQTTGGGGAGATRTVTTNDAIADVDLRIAARITDGDGNANVQNITTAQSGRLELTGANDFSGVFTVGAGRTRISSAGALGLGGATAAG